MRAYLAILILFLLPAILPAQRYLSVDLRWEEGFIYIPYNGVKAKEGIRPVYRGQGNMKVVYYDKTGGVVGSHFVKAPQFLSTYNGKNDQREYGVREGTFTVYLPYNLQISKLAIYENASWEENGDLVGDWILSTRMKHLQQN